ncbi:MAG: DUF1365 domain-containing protein [Comamonadaceae bacterium]|nr:MAG: DUF1365 domain-containing protein [Comamonadaceae bacterium]
MSGASALYTGTVIHQRLKPLKHRLRYGVFSLLIDLNELEDLDRRLRFFSLNRSNLFSLHEKDYGAGEPRGLRAHIDRTLVAAGLAAGGPVQLLTMPRILGYAFNPLTVYFCQRLDGGLQAIVYEVNNTFGERHSYVIEVAPQDAHALRLQQRCAKEFHVSPFLGLAMQYGFDIAPPRGDRESLQVGVTVHDAQGPVLVAHMHALRRPLTDTALLRAFFTHPLLTFKVVGAIHWEALKLWIKGAPLQPKPSPPAHAISYVSRKDL